MLPNNTLTLVDLGRLAQQLDQLAMVIRAQDPQAAIAQVSLTGLKDKLEAMVTVSGLADLPHLGADILAGKVKGRAVIDVSA